MPPLRLLASSLALVAAAMLNPAAAQEQAQKPIGEIYASDASVTGAVKLASSGMQVMSGASVGAGQAVALLRLTRGGNMRICPRTSLSLSSARDGLMVGMNSGAVETDYSLAAGAGGDAIITPDFRIMLAGPGNIHIAIGSDARGNTCIRPLANNSAPIMVSELMGDGTYQVGPDEQVVFERGKLANMYHVISDCGCPAPAPVMRAAAPPLEIPKIADLRSAPPPPALSIPQTQPPSPTAPLPAATAQEVHVEVDAPFVFSAEEPLPAPLEQMAELKFTSAAPFALTPAPPQRSGRKQAQKLATAGEIAQEPPRKRTGFFGKVRSFFASVFH
ncbi:MAG: hypothetical protein ACXVY9_07015 [Terriglobales bacterium]